MQEGGSSTRIGAPLVERIAELAALPAVGRASTHALTADLETIGQDRDAARLALRDLMSQINRPADH